MHVNACQYKCSSNLETWIAMYLYSYLDTAYEYLDIDSGISWHPYRFCKISFKYLSTTLQRIQYKFKSILSISFFKYFLLVYN